MQLSPGIYLEARTLHEMEEKCEDEIAKWKGALGSARHPGLIPPHRATRSWQTTLMFDGKEKD